MKIRIIRHTSHSKAIELAKTGKFVLKFKDPLNPDHGFNGFIKSRMEEYNQDQIFTGVGAVMEFEWTGKFIEIPSKSTSSLPTNILIHQPGWRAHIRGLVDENNLKLVGIRFKNREEINDLIDYPGWVCLVPFFGKLIRRRLKLKFIKFFRDSYKKRDCFVRFVIDGSSL
ncbi:hypothetical protein [Pseudomonas sp. LB3P58]|jgi:hypothetical protein